MREFLEGSVFLGVALTLLSYGLGCLLKKRFRLILFNPLLVSIVLSIAALVLLKLSYAHYYEGAKYLSYLLTPATICLAIPLYEQLELLKSNWKAILIGIMAGVLSSLGSIWAMAFWFGLKHQEYISLLPKSTTTAIGMGVSEELGGYVSLTVGLIMITGLLGNITAELVFKLARIKEPVAKGIALGTASHVMGTSKARELGEVEGAMSSLSIVVSGLLTLVGASIFAQFL